MTNLGPISVRMSEQERELLTAAAEHSRTNLSDFIRRKAVEAAEADLMMRPRTTIPARNWAKFEAWAKAPGKVVPKLATLSKTRPQWQD